MAGYASGASGLSMVEGGEHANATSFAAVYLQISDTETALSNSFHAGADFSQALETGLTREDYIEQVAYYIPLASIWIQRAGWKLYGLCQANYKEIDWVHPTAGDNWLWADKPKGFTIERWDFWVDRLRILAEDETFTSAIKELANGAADSMNCLSSQ